MSTCYPPAPSVSMINDRNGGGRAKKRPINSSSRLLDAQENQFLFSLFGQDNVSLSSAVVELLSSENRQWRRKNQGVVCLIKDYRNRAYFLRIYDLIVGKQIWDFKLYKGFKADVLQGCNQLLVFQGENDNQVFGLNFSSTDEAFEFKKHLDKRREQESRSVSQRNRGPPAHSLSIPASSTPIGNQMIRTGPSPMGMVGGVTPVGTMAAHSGKTPATSGGGLFSRGKGKKDKDKKRIRKEDISNPTNFQHKAHVGWDQDNGFSNNVYDSEPMDESIKNIIRAAGQDPTNMTKKDIKFVYDFLENYSEETPVPPSPKPAPVSSHPPPVPISQPISQWGQPPPAPPPPPSRGASHGGSVVPPSRPPPPPPNGGGRAGGARPLPQVPSSQPSDGHRPQMVPPPPPPAPPPMGGASTVPPAPPPPPPPSFVSSSAPPAPPPPPPSLGALPPGLPPPQNGRGNLLAEIQAGKSLRSVGSADNKRSPTSGDTRGDVMAQIRQGAQLKHVDTSAEQEKRRSAQGGLADMGGIAGALAKALEDRRMNMGIDESSDEDEDSDEKNEWSD